MFNESFWLAVSIVIFMVLVFKPAKIFILNLLESRINSIDIKFKEIFTISEEAEELLKKYKSLCSSAEKEISAITASADLEIKHLRENFENEIASKLKARSANILNKINNSEAKTLMKLRMQSITLSIAIVMDFLENNKNYSYQDRFLQSSIDAISSQFKEK